MSIKTPSLREQFPNVTFSNTSDPNIQDMIRRQNFVNFKDPLNPVRKKGVIQISLNNSAKVQLNAAPVDKVISCTVPMRKFLFLSDEKYSFEEAEKSFQEEHPDKKDYTKKDIFRYIEENLQLEDVNEFTEGKKKYITHVIKEKVKFGIPVRFDGQEAVCRALRFEYNRQFYLDNETDAEDWHCMQHSARIKGSTRNKEFITGVSGRPGNQKYAKELAIFNVIDKEADLKIYEQFAEENSKAKEYIRSLTGNNLYEEATFWNIPFESYVGERRDSFIKRELENIADRKPKEVGKSNVFYEKMVNSALKKVIIIFNRGIRTRVIQDRGKGFEVISTGKYIGHTPEAAYDTLMKHADIAFVVDNEGKAKDSKLGYYHIEGMEEKIKLDEAEFESLKEIARKLGINVGIKKAETLAKEIKAKEASNKIK
jgi:hypothetical protein